MLSQHNNVYAFDISKEKVDMVNNKKSPFFDKNIQDFLENKNLSLIATTNIQQAFENTDYIIIATPTNYDPNKHSFDTHSVEQIIEQALKISPSATIVIKSTVPIGFTDSMIKKYNYKNILFSPEFLREGYALYDNLYPSRIIVGCVKENKSIYNYAEKFATLLSQGAQKKNIPTIIMNLKETESVKLFSNAYLALRVSFFNELDTYAEINSLNTKQIIDGISLDPRIGNFYNNPSFGYGGYCLPKDTKQLLNEFNNVPNNIISAIVDSNETRKDFIVNTILNKKPNVIGIYRLTMKSNADNFRQSAIIDIIEKLDKNHVKIIIYEPTLNSSLFMKYPIVNDFNEFKKSADLIVANRYDKQLDTIINKVYTKDIYFNN